MVVSSYKFWGKQLGFWKKNDKNNSFSITRLEYWSSRGGEDTLNRLQIILELRISKAIELHVKELETKDLKLLTDFSLAD